MVINWEVIIWTCVTIGVLVGIFAIILSVISALNMKKRRQQMADIHTTLAIGSKVMFAGGIYGKVVRMNGDDEVIGVEIAPKTIIDISRFAIQAIEKNEKAEKAEK
jgi:preprotein translocase subunit YajC